MILEGSLLSDADARALFGQVLAERVAAVAGELPTAREREVLYHRVALGMGNQAIADELVVSVHTIEAHLLHVSLRLRYAHNQAQMRADLFRAFARAEVRVSPVA